MIIILLQITAGILVVVYKEELSTELEEDMVTQAKNHVTNDPSDPLTAAWFTMQYEVHVRLLIPANYKKILLTVS